jgi:hypothetical protein
MVCLLLIFDRASFARLISEKVMSDAVKINSSTTSPALSEVPGTFGGIYSLGVPKKLSRNNFAS